MKRRFRTYFGAGPRYSLWRVGCGFGTSLELAWHRLVLFVVLEWLRKTWMFFLVAWQLVAGMDLTGLTGAAAYG